MQASPTRHPTAVQLDAIYVYPVKSCAGVALDTATIDACGLTHDRRYMVVDANGRFVSLRTDPALVTVQPRIEATTYVLSAPGMEPLRIPHTLHEGPALDASIWSDQVATIEHAAGSEFFSRVLGRRAHLVHLPAHSERGVAPERGRPGDRVALTDAFPLLLVSRESLASLSADAGVELSVERFRPNLVMSGAAPYVEDRFAEVRIGDVTFRGPKACDRCVATTVDPRSAAKGPEPLRTLARVRRANGKVWFGMNLIHDSVGELRTGASISPLRLHDAPAFG